jgi:hypothetical protein
MVGIVNMLASLLSVYLVKFFGRRTLVIWGHMMIAIIHAATGILNNANESTGVICCVLAFLVVYQNTSGPVAWLYAAETTIDAALGLCLFTLWGTVVILSETCPILMEDSVIGPSNTFFLLSAFGVLGSMYGFFFMRESQGLSDK